MSLRCGVVGLSNVGKSTLFTISHNAEIRTQPVADSGRGFPGNSGI